MPNVPTITGRQVAPRGLPSARLDSGATPAAFGNDLGRAGTQVAGALEELAQKERDRADTAALLDGENQFNAWEEGALTNPQSGALNRSGKDAFDLPNQVMPQFEQEAQRIEGGLGSARAQQRFRELTAQRRQYVNHSLNQHEARERDGYYDAQDVAALQSSRGVAANYYDDPQRIAGEIRKQELIVDGRAGRKGWAPEQTAEAKRVARSDTHTDVVSRYIARGEWKKGEIYLDAVRDQIGAQDATRLDAHITNERERAEAKAQHEADRAEMRGDRTLLKIDRQIASGIPATPAMWDEWANDVKGTPASAEFSDRLKDEQEVQAVLRKPLNEQTKYVLDKEAELTSGGGTLAQAQNVARLRTAVNQNAALMQQAPLVYNAQRTGAQFAPLDVSTLVQTSAPEATAKVMNERVVALQAMREQYGNVVPFAPLLPQEVQQLSGALEQASPQQAVDAYAALYNSLGSADVYKGAMQQLAPDAPVKALAGLLASKPVDITIEKNLFRADVTAPAQRIAATMLEGERLLVPSKTAKKEDGKPSTTRLYLPESKSLQQAFTDQVGSAFAGRPAAAETAFQAVQAYYVGKASQTGRLATDSKDIDSDIVKESITSVLGTVVDYNGNGQVLAPWGMDQGTFEDRVEGAFARELKRHELPDSLVDMLPALGLRNNGDGTYYVVQGRSFVSDRQGVPLVINVTETVPTQPPYQPTAAPQRSVQGLR